MLDPDLGLLQEEETVYEHARHRNEAQAEGDAPHSVQGVVVVLFAGLAEDGQQDAQDGRVHQVTPSLQHASSHWSVILSSCSDLHTHNSAPITQRRGQRSQQQDAAGCTLGYTGRA